MLSESGVLRWLKTDGIQVRVRPVVTSTNDVLKDLAAEGAAEGLALLAEEQTQGRGRMGRSFYSPPGTGLYMSVLLRPAVSAGAAAEITACAAVAAAEAIEELSGRGAGIKWVNDVLLDGKKVCGILTEAATDPESGAPRWVVVGIGVNIAPPAGDFPEELRSVAGAVFEKDPGPDCRCRLAAGILDRLTAYSQRPGDARVYRAYKARSLALGRNVALLVPGREPISAEALDIGADYSLLVRLEDGSLQEVRSGEISLRL